MLRVTIKEYIKKLKELEAQKLVADPTYTPAHIPNIAEMAAHSGVSGSHYYKFAGNRTANINRAIPGRVAAYLRSLGFDTQTWDFLTEETE